MRKWATAQAPLREVSGGRKLCDLPFGSLCDPTGGTYTMTYGGVSTHWTEVIYPASTRSWRGWVYSPLLEDYDETLHPPVVDIIHQTPNPTDAAQYMIWLNQVQYNLCGELCVCYITGATLDVFLEEWQISQPNIFKRIFGDGRARGTGPDELNNMLAVFGRPLAPRLGAGLHDPLLNRPLVTPGRFAQMLEIHRAIVGVKIDGVTGNLRGGGIPHWVVVDSVIPDGINRGTVKLYNPFPNQMQTYSWDEMVKSMASPSGLWVERNS